MSCGLGKIARVLGAFVAMATLATCGTVPARLEGLAREDFPSDLPFPALTGGPGEIADQLCNWARENQDPFPAVEMEEVRVNSVHERGGFAYARSGLLSEFASLGTNPRTLIMEVGPDDLFLPRGTTPVDPYKAVINRRAHWSFTRRPAVDCAANDAGLVAINGRCILVEEVGESTEISAVMADYRIFAFRAIAFPGRRQALSITVLTLYRADDLIGRSIFAHAYAGPMDLGRVNRSCEPVVSPWRFESVEEQ